MSEPELTTGAAPTAALRVLTVTGPDTISFLQGQLTHDAALLDDGRTLLAACNTPQGRVVAILRLKRSGEAIHALVAHDLAAPLLAHLRKYVLRARVRLELEPRPPHLVEGEIRDTHDRLPMDRVQFDWAPRRAVLVGTIDPRTSAGRGTPVAMPGDEANAAAGNSWLLADIAAGLPQVWAATSGRFVAQMLNLDLVDGISFSKGCYTGQEIVARTQHLGRIKRRMLRYAIPDGPPPPLLAGLYRGDVKVAEVVASAARATGCEILAVTQLDARGSQLSLEDGRAAEPLPLPYAV